MDYGVSYEMSACTEERKFGGGPASELYPVYIPQALKLTPLLSEQSINLKKEKK